MSNVLYSQSMPNGSYNYYNAAASGLYLSYETGSHYAELYKDSRAIWIESPSGIAAGNPVKTGDTIYLLMEILFTNWLGMAAELPWNLTWAKIGTSSSFEFQIWTDLGQSSGSEIPVGTPVYFTMPGYQGGWVLQAQGSVNLQIGSSFEALPFTLTSS